MAKPLVLLKPAPQSRERIFTAAAWDRLNRSFEVVDLESGERDEGDLARLLPDAFALIGQPDLPAALLETAPELRAIVNVEGNFFPNVDYPTAFRNGVRVLGCGTAYAQAVAEFALGLALDLARGISREDHRARQGEERYVAAATGDAVLLQRAPVGLVGFGNLGRALRPLLAPFQGVVRAYDPWLPRSVLEDAGVVPATLEETLAASRFVFVLATVTAESEHLLDARMLDLLPEGARVVLVSRAAVVDYDALLERVESGRLFAAIDVWPEEPIPADSPWRRQEAAILSPHRAGGIPQAFTAIGDMVVDDLELLAKGLPPVRLQVAAPELVGRYRNRPVTGAEQRRRGSRLG
jgi:phosphoglycerate dehydrogenase-like enzyme